MAENVYEQFVQINSKVLNQGFFHQKAQLNLNKLQVKDGEELKKTVLMAIGLFIKALYWKRSPD